MSKRFPAARNLLGPTSWHRAVDFVDLDVYRGETLALVGESGCGKTTLARLVLRVLKASSGSVRFEQMDVLAASPNELRGFRRRVQLVFQDPYASLDPRKRVEWIVGEGMPRGEQNERERRARVRDLLDLVGLPPTAASRFPHEFSGGERQRISIARALAIDPTLLIVDEPVSALDPSVQSRVLNLLAELQGRLGLTYLFISHDLSVVRHVANRVAVMYLGKIVERPRLKRCSTSRCTRTPRRCSRPSPDSFASRSADGSCSRARRQAWSTPGLRAASRRAAFGESTVAEPRRRRSRRRETERGRAGDVEAGHRTTHLLPNLAGTVIVMASYYVSITVITEAAFSFIGFGAQPPTPSLGTMIAEGRDYWSVSIWPALVPGVAIALIVLGLNSLGDALRDVFDPRRQRW